MGEEKEMSERTKCAHRLVSYNCERNDDGTWTGWWECDSGCGMNFTPIIHPAESEIIIPKPRIPDDELFTVNTSGKWPPPGAESPSAQLHITTEDNKLPDHEIAVSAQWWK